MKRKIFLKILVGAVSIVLIVKILTTVIFEPWLGRIIYSELNEENRSYIVEIDKVHILIIKSGLELEGIRIYSKQTNEDDHGLNAEIESINLKGLNLAKAIFRHEIHIGTATILNSNIRGNLPLPGKAMPPIVSPLKIGIGRLLFDKIDLEMKNSSNAKAYSIKEGVLKVYDLLVEKQDTLFPGRINLFDLEAKELVSGSSESVYSYIVRGLSYSANSNSLSIDSLYIHPNYTDYDFTSRYKFQKSRIEAVFSNIYINDFYLDGYLTSLRLKSPYIEIGKMNMNVFRDRRKEISHLNRPVLQDMLYGFPGTIQIDSIGLLNGNVTIRVHAEEANEPGSISFNKLNAKIYNVTNDTIYKTKRAFLEIKANALIMGKGKTAILLKGKLFDRNNTFSLKGTLSNLEANELNPILEKNAFIYVTSGKIDEMNFSYTADNTKATGEMTMLYHGLNVTVKNKRTDDTIALRERFISFIANRRIFDSNPLKDEKVRVGIIDYERDPERFILHYCFNSILSGITSSLTNSKRKGAND
jgi:hypothetical protein